MTAMQPDDSAESDDTIELALDLMRRIAEHVELDGGEHGM